MKYDPGLLYMCLCVVLQMGALFLDTQLENEDCGFFD